MYKGKMQNGAARAYARGTVKTQNTQLTWLLLGTAEGWSLASTSQGHWGTEARVGWSSCFLHRDTCPFQGIWGYLLHLGMNKGLCCHIKFTSYKGKRRGVARDKWGQLVGQH